MEMKELTALGITEEQANKVLEKHTAELTAEQQKTSELTAELSAAKNTVSELTEKVRTFDGVDIEGLKKSAESWESKYNADIAALKLDKALELSLIGAKARDVGIVKGQIDTSTLKLGDDGKLLGLDEQLDKLRTDKSFLFEETAADTGARIDTGLDHGSASETITDAQARAVMGLPVENGGK